MCGIVGYLGSFNTNSGTTVINNMNNQIIHRGPDDQGIHVENNIALGMRRLSIVDIQHGHQPMYDENKDFIIIFNGEIYNHGELRETLKNNGVLFNTDSDTEVILKSYIYYGDKFIHNLNGMFSFAIYNKKDKKIIIYRDRMGVKPLYYYFNKEDKVFLFGSELKSIVKSGVFSKDKQIENTELSNFLTLRYTSHKKSIWKNINKLTPGHYLEFNLENFNIKANKYWQYDFNSSLYPKDKYSNYLGEFKNILIDSVKIRMESSDVPVGIFLSGGLDSSVIAALAKKSGFNEFHTFSVGFENDSGQNEFTYAKEVSDYIGSIHHEVVVTQDQFINYLPDYVKSSDEPFADLTSIPLYFMSKKASEFVKVVLSGEGADEILAGYSLDKLKKNISILNILSKPIISTVVNLFLKEDRRSQLKIMTKYGKENFLKKTNYYISKYWNESEKTHLLKDFDKVKNTNSFIQTLYEYESKDVIEQFSNSHSMTWLVEDLLAKGDKMTMGASIEARSPFLDYRLVEFSMKLPSKYKVNNNNINKLILRDYAKELIPESIINRPKKGFSIPIYQWIKDDLKDWAYNLIKDSDKLDLVINKHIVLEEFNTLNTNVMSAHKIWIIIILHYWLKEWNITEENVRS